MKRILALLLALALLLGTCVCMAEGTENEDLDEEYPDELIKVDDLMTNMELDSLGWWNILLLGGDSRSNGSYGRTDTIIILSVNPKTKQVRMTSIMRDSWVKIYGYGSNRINAANAYGGPELIMRTVNENFGMNISKYILVDMRAFWDVVDLIDGIDVALTEREMQFVNEQQLYNCREAGRPETYTKLTEYGENVHLDGNQALAYVRIRKLDSDFNRTNRQRAALVAMAKKIQENCTLTTIFSLLKTLLTYVETNTTISELASLAKLALTVDMNGIEQLRLPVDGTFVSETVDGKSRLTIANLKANKDALYNFIYGK